jgi:hypothetical protein
MLAYDESLRMSVAHAARLHLERLVAPDELWAGWARLFQTLGEHISDVPGIPHAHSYHATQAVEVAA